MFSALSSDVPARALRDLACDEPTAAWLAAQLQADLSESHAVAVAVPVFAVLSQLLDALLAHRQSAYVCTLWSDASYVHTMLILPACLTDF